MDTINQTVIFGGGDIDRQLALEMISPRPENCLIGVDRGVKFLYDQNIVPDHIVGDFDSLPAEILDYYRRETKVPIQTYDPIKDATDMEIAIELAMEIGYPKIILLGATGTRIDHVWANIQTILLAFKRGFEAEILDPYNRIRIISGDTLLRKEESYGPFFSLFSLAGPVEHFSIQGAKYPLTDHVLQPTGSLCVSNEFIGDVRITFPQGDVVLMETRD